MEHALFEYKPKEVSDAPHELSASVNYIKEHLGFKGQYDGGYWLRKIKESGKTEYQVRKLVDHAMTLDETKYNRGGYLTNQLK